MTEPFNLGSIRVEPGTRKHAELAVMKQPDGKTTGIPLLIIHGGKPGPRFYVSGGVHGDEVVGTASIIDVANSLEASQLAGTFIGAPVVSVAAFLHKVSVDVAGIRENPVDWKNLARIFPGRAEGTLTERLADAISNQIFPFVDYVVDLHSGGNRGFSLNMAGFLGVEGDLGETSLQLAKLFPIETMWRISPWVTMGEAAVGHGIPLVACEVFGQGRADKSDVAVYVAGVKNVMKHLGMIPGELEGLPEQRQFIDSETYLYASDGGFLRPHVEMGEIVNKDQLLGIVQDIYGSTVEEVRSPIEGIITGIRTKPVVWAGEPTILVANLIPDPAQAGLGETSVRGHVTPP